MNSDATSESISNYGPDDAFGRVEYNRTVSDMKILKFIIRVLVLILISLHPATLLRAQADEKFAGDIREQDLRVSEILNGLRDGQAAPTTIRLRYSGTRGDYLAFYDYVGREIYYRYRRNRFDDRAERKIQWLIAGQAYAVQGDYTGIMSVGVFYSRNDDRYREILGEPDIMPVYNYQGAQPLRLEQIIIR